MWPRRLPIDLVPLQPTVAIGKLMEAIVGTMIMVTAAAKIGIQVAGSLVTPLTLAGNGTKTAVKEMTVVGVAGRRIVAGKKIAAGKTMAGRKINGLQEVTKERVKLEIGHVPIVVTTILPEIGIAANVEL